MKAIKETKDAPVIKEPTKKQKIKFNIHKPLPVTKPNKIHGSRKDYDRQSAKKEIEEQLEEMGGIEYAGKIKGIN